MVHFPQEPLYADVLRLVRLEGDIADLEIEVLGLKEVAPSLEVVEDRDSFLGNATKKAREWARATGLATLADDSGLEVDALGGAPGIHSARYAGPDATDAENNAKLLAALADVPDAERTARFRCALVLVDAEGEVLPGTFDAKAQLWTRECPVAAGMPLRLRRVLFCS